VKGRYGLEGYYQVIYEGKSRLLKKWKKKRAQFVIEARYDEFQPDDVLILVKNETAYQVKNRRKLLKVMDDNKREIRIFMRKENIHPDFKNPESIIPVLEYYDSL
jgi:CO dehydrogenase/acetyl-CoA synthase alpha subunit